MIPNVLENRTTVRARLDDRSQSMKLANMIERDDTVALAQALTRELDVVRARLAGSIETSKGGGAAINAFALSESIERLCRQAVLCNDKQKSFDLLASAGAQLDDLQRLLGPH